MKLNGFTMGSNFSSFSGTRERLGKNIYMLNRNNVPLFLTSFFFKSRMGEGRGNVKLVTKLALI